MIFPVILCGGSGTRLWPLSRELYPKQFLSLSGESTLLHTVLKRTRSIDKAGAPILLCNEAHRFLVAEQLRETGIEDAVILLEPVAKNTAPAAAIGALEALSQDEDPVLLVMPADHVINDQNAFVEAAVGGMEAARAGKLVTFGIVPTGPETGFGYIKKGAPAGNAAFQVDAFVEKPDPDTASAYVSSGEYLWN
ncbi:MAG: mannose-1-phosphate guanylyltransferase, partial [Oceanidesulfovibrio sp.]